MTDEVVEGKDGELVLPLASFVCSAWNSGELVLKSADLKQEARILGDGLDESLSRDLVARGARIERAMVTADSTLRLDFDRDASIAISASEAAEAWTVLGPGTLAVIAGVDGDEPHIGETHSFGPGDPVPTWVAEAMERAIDLFGKEEDQ